MNVSIYSCPNDDKDFTIDTEPEIRVVGNYDWNVTRVSDSVKRLEEENKRLEQENEKLKKEFKEEHAELLMSRAENERLKSEILMWQEQVEKRNEICDVWIETASNYKQAFEEIREVAKIAFIVCDDECGNANKFAEIQDKINEVLK